MEKEIIDAIEENNDYIAGNLYDYIANNYHAMSKEELKGVLLEVIYTLNDINPSKDMLINSLKERFDI